LTFKRKKRWVKDDPPFVYQEAPPPNQALDTGNNATEEEVL